MMNLADDKKAYWNKKFIATFSVFAKHLKKAKKRKKAVNGKQKLSLMIFVFYDVKCVIH